MVKIGGAAITDKASARTDVPSNLVAIAATLAKAGRPGRLILVHGAGSFGHFEAREYRLNSTDVSDFPVKSAMGIARCRASLAQLHSRVLDALVSAGIPVASIPTFPCAIPSFEDVSMAISVGLVPVMHGDIVLLPGRGHDTNPCRVLSGDEIVARLCLARDPVAWPPGRRPASRAVFITGVAGVFTAHPGSPGARLIHQIEVVDSAADVALAVHGREEDALWWVIAGCSCRLTLWDAAAGMPVVASSSPAAASSASEPIAALPVVTGTDAAVADITGGIQGKLAAAVRMVRDLQDARFVVSVAGPRSGATLDVLCDADAPRDAILASHATHILWSPIPSLP